MPRRNRRRRTQIRRQTNASNAVSGVHSNQIRNIFLPSLIAAFEDLALSFGGAGLAHYVDGEGSFGLVTQGSLKSPNGKWTRVALKRPKRLVFNEMMMEEAEIMTNFDHANVLKLVGVQASPFKIIMEYMIYGDLLDALRKKIFSSNADFMNILLQITSGMEYISEKKYVHGDLACRNVFVNGEKQCKIGDFGLCKYVGESGFFEVEGFLKYSAPEVAKTNKLTSKCDVWSMGLLIWELYFSISGNNEGHTNKIIMDIFMNTKLLPKPDLCPANLFLYVKEVLLNRDAKKRPIFAQVHKDLLHIFNKQSVQSKK